MRILVIGASGLVGSNIAVAAAQQNWEVLGTWRSEPVEIFGASVTGLDLSERSAGVAVASAFEPDVIVHVAGDGRAGRFERDARLSELFVHGVEHTLAAARIVRARHVLVSCDWVFSGLRSSGRRWDETDLPEPVNAYGRAHLAAEELVCDSNVPGLITRMGDVYGVNLSKPARGLRGERSKVVGAGGSGRREGAGGGRLAWHVWERSGAALRLVRLLLAGKPLPAPKDVYRSPTYAWDYAQRLCELLAQRREGIIHTAGPDSVHRREYLRALALAFHGDPELVHEGSLAGLLEASGEDPSLPLPPNTALAGERARVALGHPSVDMEAGLGLMSDQLHRVLNGP
ncbi:MAG TPA: sugar nucleotide-binding protein [Solirubrobacteraceae bacterium]|jgi:dTDP-4-dehydrorhamnose reductase